MNPSWGVAETSDALSPSQLIVMTPPVLSKDLVGDDEAVGGEVVLGASSVLGCGSETSTSLRVSVLELAPDTWGSEAGVVAGASPATASELCWSGAAVTFVGDAAVSAGAAAIGAGTTTLATACATASHAIAIATTVAPSQLTTTAIGREVIRFTVGTATLSGR